MNCWPVPQSYQKKVPVAGEPGSFHEDRGDRWHCGVDIYAPVGSEVIAISDGIVCEIGTQTSPRMLSYWYDTFYILIRHADDLYIKYAELSRTSVKAGEQVKAHQVIGLLGPVIDMGKIGRSAPEYIRKLKSENRNCMLHLEVYNSRPAVMEEYRGGNWFGKGQPDSLVDPADILRSFDTIEGKNDDPGSFT